MGSKYDCEGVCGGTAVVDDCGVCNGPGLDFNVYCSCSLEVLDECGVCGGTGV